MPNEQEALLYEKLPDFRVRCNLCAHTCLIANSHTGKCRVRLNQNGNLYSLIYGRLIAAHTDPIEKKPLFHFYPGSLSYSIASPGCNFTCKWCQNWEISQPGTRTDFSAIKITAPEKIVAEALRNGCKSIAYTYTEPTIFFEYTLEVSKLAHAVGLKNVYVTNGYMSRQMIEMYTPYLDAANVDIKAFSDEAYRKYSGAHLQPVLDACILLKKAGVWLEITTLLIPGVNDDKEQVKELAEFIAVKLGTETPWHVSRYFPQYQFTQADATPLESIEQALEIGRRAGLKFTYGGNIPGSVNTCCPTCGASLIERYSMSVTKNRVAQSNRCPDCGETIPGIMLERH
ncbi:MAG: AmmeMemoRadiSam system radical SAM enzyme [Anaerolineaceae bacterium]